MSPWRLIADSLGQRLDADLLPAVYAAASVPTSVLREEFRAAGIAFVDAVAGEWPDDEALARSVVAVTKGSARAAAAARARALSASSGRTSLATAAPRPSTVSRQNSAVFRMRQATASSCSPPHWLLLLLVVVVVEFWMGFGRGI